MVSTSIRAIKKVNTTGGNIQRQGPKGSNALPLTAELGLPTCISMGSVCAIASSVSAVSSDTKAK